MMARPMIEVERDGRRSMHEYDVIRYFDSADKALQYAATNNIEDVHLS